MRKRDPYVILGVSPRESPGKIRSAFRRLARELHPDVAGSRSTEAFRRLTEAYQTLSDPVRRDEYDREQSRLRGSRGSVYRDPGRVVQDPEPPAPEGRSPHHNFQGRTPLQKAPFGRGRWIFGMEEVSASGTLEPIDFEVLLSPHEAAGENQLTIPVPLTVRCPRCGGVGANRIFPCHSCGRRGLITKSAFITLWIPPMARRATTLEYSLESVGLQNLLVRLHIAVTGWS